MAGEARPWHNLAMLQALGVTESEERTYRALLRAPGGTALEVAAALDRPVADAKPDLRRLEDLGMVTRLTGTPVRFTPTRPDIAVEVLVAERQRELVAAQAAAQSLMQEMAPRDRRAPEELVEIVHGKQAVGHRYSQMESTVIKELLVLDRPPYNRLPSGPNEPELAMLARGITVRGIYAPEGLELPGRMAELAELAEAGEESRVSPLVPRKLAIADRSTALLPLSTEQVTDQALVVRGPTLIDALVALFDVLWQLAIPLADVDLDNPDAPLVGPALNDTQQRLLSLLAVGLSDRAIARELAVSPRTLSRQLALLTESLGVKSRFQAGMQAVKRGLL